MKRIFFPFSSLLVLSLYLLSAQTVLAEELLCKPEDIRHLARVSVNSKALTFSVQNILERERATIERALTGLIIDKNLIVSPDHPIDCPRYKDVPGFDSDSLCLYVPRFLFGEAVPVSQVAQSFSTYMNFDRVKISRFQLGKLEAQCSEGHFCDVSGEILHLDIESHFDLIDQKSGQKVLSTVSPAWLTIDSDSLENKARVGFRARVTQSGRAREVFKIDRDSFFMDIPPENIKSGIHHNREDIPSRAVHEIERRLESESLTELDLDKEVERLFVSYSLISFARDLMGDFNFGQAHWPSIYSNIAEPVSHLFSEIIEAHIPISENKLLTLPLLRVQDMADGERHLPLLYSYMNFIDTEMDRIELNPLTKITNSDIERASKNIRDLKRVARELKSSSLIALTEELRLLSIRLQVYRHILKTHNSKIWSSVISELESAPELLKNTAESIEENAVSIEKTMKLRVSYFHPVAESEKLGVIISGCEVAGKTPESTFHFRGAKKTTPNDSNYDFSIEAPLDVINEYLATLYNYNYFNVCLSDSEESCLEMDQAKTRTVYRLGRPPRIVYDEKLKRYVLWIRDLERDRVTFLGKFLSRMFFSETTQVKVCIDADFNGKGVDDECIHLKANLAANLRGENALAALNPFSAVGMFSWKLLRTLGQQKAFDTALKNGELSNPINERIRAYENIELTELRAEGELLTLFGRIK